MGPRTSHDDQKQGRHEATAHRGVRGDREIVVQRDTTQQQRGGRCRTRSSAITTSDYEVLEEEACFYHSRVPVGVSAGVTFLWSFF